MADSGTMFILSAPSGAGKSSLIQYLLTQHNTDDRLRLSVSHTTRNPRPGETNHISYHFVTKEEFTDLINKNLFYEYANVFDHYYGTSKTIVDTWISDGKDVFLDIDWQGARQILEKNPDAVSIFILPPSLSELEKRLKLRRQDSPDVIEKRMHKARSEISHYSEYKYVVINDSFEQCADNIWAIIRASRMSFRCQKDSLKTKISDL